MEISLTIRLSDGTSQVVKTTLPAGSEVTGYSVDVNGLRVATNRENVYLDLLTANQEYVYLWEPRGKTPTLTNSLYGKTGRGKAAAAETGPGSIVARAAQVVANICGCGVAAAHLGGILRARAAGAQATWPPKQV